jgi:hypothetical protein
MVVLLHTSIAGQQISESLLVWAMQHFELKTQKTGETKTVFFLQKKAVSLLS